MAQQKATLFVFLYLAIPAAGIGAGIGWGVRTHSPLNGIIGSTTGLLIGGIIAWQLPMLLWNLLHLFARKGWFVVSVPSLDFPVMTKDEFIAKSEAWWRKEQRHFQVWVCALIAGGFVCACLVIYLGRIKPESWIHILAIIGNLVFYVGMFSQRSQDMKQLVRKHDLQCPTCGRQIDGPAGALGIPDSGLCRHCGTKVVEIDA